MDGADGVDPDTPEWLVAKEVEVLPALLLFFVTLDPKVE